MALNDDDSAADSLPIALAGTVILVAIIIALAASGIMNATPQSLEEVPPRILTFGGYSMDLGYM
jgi:hypothetical protein